MTDRNVRPTCSMFNWIQSLPFVAPWFFVAGALCALGPVIIHLLNRRRFRVVEWAAMDFLREALQRNRKIMQLRDILLMALRTLAVLLLGAALARTACNVTGEKFDASKPLHAVVMIDNSLSMGFQSLDGSMLDLAKKRAGEYIEKLPPGSRTTIVPVGGARNRPSLEPYRTKEEALSALRRIELVDRTVSVQQAANLAKQAVEAEPELAKRLLLFSDQQRGNWTGMLDAQQIARLPEMQLVEVVPESAENIWIADFQLQDGLADIGTPATLVATVQGASLAAAQDVQVSLEIEGATAATKIVQLDAGDSSREVRFEYRFDGVRPEPGLPEFVPVKVSLPPDRLPADDHRALVVPVVSALPVVFADQYGSQGESVVNNRLGETRSLRKLLAPGGADAAARLISIRHVTLDQLTRDMLSDARLVVVAGVDDPTGSVDLLREYIEQGGQLLIAAGGEFEADAWNQTAWRSGLGILPLPLDAAPIGALPRETDTLTPFFLDFESLRHHHYFHLAGVSESNLRDLYAEPFVFKAVRANDDTEPQTELRENESKRREALQKLLDERAELVAQQNGTAAADLEAAAAGLDKQIADMQPDWLRWKSEASAEESDSAGEAIKRTLPRVLARLDNRAPLIVEREIDRGRVVMLTTGLSADWSTLPRTNTFLIMDRIARDMIESTLPRRNYPAVDQIVLPVDAAHSSMVAELIRPGAAAGEREILDIGFIGSNQRGVVIENAVQRGVYQVALVPQQENGSAEEETSSTAAPAAPVSFEISVAGDPAESELVSLDRRELESLAAEGPLFWVSPGEEISLAGQQVRGQDWWRYFVIAILVVLGLEMLIAAGASAVAAMRGNSVNGKALAAGDS